MNNNDLADVIKAICCLSDAIKVVGKHLPPASAQHLAEAHQGVVAALTSIANRHDPQPVEFSEADNGCVSFITNIPFVLDDPQRNKSFSVAQARPTPPRPKTDKE